MHAEFALSFQLERWFHNAVLLFLKISSPSAVRIAHIAPPFKRHMLASQLCQHCSNTRSSETDLKKKKLENEGENICKDTQYSSPVVSILSFSKAVEDAG